MGATEPHFASLCIFANVERPCFPLLRQFNEKFRHLGPLLRLSGSCHQIAASQLKIATQSLILC